MGKNGMQSNTFISCYWETMIMYTFLYQTMLCFSKNSLYYWHYNYLSIFLYIIVSIFTTSSYFITYYFSFLRGQALFHHQLYFITEHALSIPNVNQFLQRCAVTVYWINGSNFKFYIAHEIKHYRQSIQVVW